MRTSQDMRNPPGGAGSGAPLRRDPNGKVVAGVCSGLGRYFGVDPIIFRIGFAALALAGAAGVVLYGLAWLFVPEDGQDESAATAAFHAHRPGRDPLRWLGWALGAVALIIVAGNWGPGHQTGNLAAGLVLGGVAVLILTTRQGPSEAGPPPAPPAWPMPGAGPEAALPAGESEAGVTAADLGTPPVWPPEGDEPAGTTAERRPPMWPPAGVEAPAARPPRPRSPLGRITVSLLAIAAGVALLLDRTGAASITVAGFLSVALAAVGVALVIGAWWGRARGLVFLGLLLTAAAAAATLVTVPLEAGVGDRTYHPASAAALADSYRLSIGELTLDLRDAAPAPGHTEAVTAEVGVGHLVVLLPAGAAVAVDAKVSAGEIETAGHHDEGTSVHTRTNYVPLSEGGGVLRLRLSAGAGQVEVLR